tara:strand:+ start:52 stop:243 length:192 start_codon:yes stop_codon:yes gene_type:complete
MDILNLTLEYLEALPTLCTGQADDLKIEADGVRIWLGRVEDGTVFIETFDGDRWAVTDTYQAK